MYGFLLESVQHFIVEECGEEVWAAILRESGAKNVVFNAHQSYPDALMLRLAISLCRRYNPCTGSPNSSAPSSPAPRKLSQKKRSLKKQGSRDERTFKCPFTAAAGMMGAPFITETIEQASKQVAEILPETPPSSEPASKQLSTYNCEDKDIDPTKAEKFATPEKVLVFFGRCFVKFFSNYGYDRMIRATGRYFCVFLQSVDNIHQRMKFSFPRMRSPTMRLARAHHNGAELVYRTTRNGLAHYLIGQLYEIAEDIFSLKLKASIVKETTEGTYNEYVLKLEFDNNDYVQSLLRKKSLRCSLAPVPVSLLLQLFPFGVFLNRQMKIVRAGEKLIRAWGGPAHVIEKMNASEIFRLRKPKTTFTFDKFVSMQSVLFELELLRWSCSGAGRGNISTRRTSQNPSRLILLRGEMRLLEENDAIIYLCSPIFNSLDELNNAGLYLADLNGHGLSRELLLAGWQHFSKLELLFEKAETRSCELEQSMKLRDEWKKRGDRLLYSMIPKTIADHLRAGKDPMAACQAFECVTVMFCALSLPETNNRSGVMQTVAEINDVYSRIDRLLENHRVYKVETVGSVYMVVSGAPERARTHTSAIASAALEIIRAIPSLTIGIHSGPVVACVLGRKLPRYCLVGDTVNTASRMQSTSQSGKIQISGASASALTKGRFRLRTRGMVKVKGKGFMETFWLEGEVEEEDQEDALYFFTKLIEN